MKIDDVLKMVDAGFASVEIGALDTAGAGDKIVKLLDAGMTADQIKALDTDGLFTYASGAPAADPAPADPEPAPAADPEPVDYKAEIDKAVKEGFETLITALQSGAIASSQQPQAQNSDDVLARIIAPPMISKGGNK